MDVSIGTGWAAGQAYILYGLIDGAISSFAACVPALAAAGPSAPAVIPTYLQADFVRVRGLGVDSHGQAKA